MRRRQIAMSVYLSHRETNGTKRATEVALAARRGTAGERIDDFLIEHGRRIPSGGVNLARMHVADEPAKRKINCIDLDEAEISEISKITTIPATFAPRRLVLSRRVSCRCGQTLWNEFRMRLISSFPTGKRIAIARFQACTRLSPMPYARMPYPKYQQRKS